MGIFDIFGTGDQQQAAQDQISGINRGLGGLTSDINQGNSALTSNYTSALQPFMTNLGTAQGGVDQLKNLLGLNGASGNTAAMTSLQNTPGYQFQLQQGNNAITAADAASGKTGSGNEALALSNYNQGLAGTTYQNAVQNLMPFLQSSNTNAAGVGNLYAGLGQGLNANYGKLGDATYGANTSIGNANANADLAGLGASSNILGSAIGLGGMFLGLSDARAKDDIEPVGALYDGQTVYKYRYKGDPRHQIGLMAQEVEEHLPEAVGEFGFGLKGVDYDAATRFAADLGRFL